MFEIIHYIHIAAAATFVGAVIFFDWAVGTAMLKMSPEERLKLSSSLSKPAMMVIIISLLLTVAAGITRLFMSGAIQTWSDLFTGYGLRATLAIAVIVISELIATPFRKKMREGLQGLDDRKFVLNYRTQAIITAVMLGLVLYLMVAMRMGLY